ncbi:MAG: hypothetical protein ACQESG_04645 [Nanobdellota archaeon]
MHEDDVIIVEGKKDVRSLCELGFENTIIPLSRRPLYKVVEDVARRGRRTHILTDFDKRGKQLYRYLYHHLTRHGVKIDNRFREYLMRYTPVVMIENLSNYCFKQQKRLAGTRLAEMSPWEMLGYEG